MKLGFLILVMSSVIVAIFIVVGLFAWPGWLVQKETKVKNIDNSTGTPVVTDLSTEQKTLYEQLLEDPDKLEEFIKTLVEQGNNIDTFNEQQKAIYDVLCSPGNLESLEKTNRVCPHGPTFAENGVNSCSINCLKMYKQNCQEDWCKYDMYAALFRGGQTAEDPKAAATIAANKKFVMDSLLAAGTLDALKKKKFDKGLDAVMTPFQVFDLDAVKPQFDKCPKWTNAGKSGNSNVWDGHEEGDRIKWEWNHEAKEEDGKCLLRASGSLLYPSTQVNVHNRWKTVTGHYDCKAVGQYAAIKRKGEWIDNAPTCEGDGGHGKNLRGHLRDKLHGDNDSLYSCALHNNRAPECDEKASGLE